MFPILIFGLKRIVSIISHIKQLSWYYYSHLTDEETTLRKIKQVTQLVMGQDLNPGLSASFPYVIH